MSHDGDAEDTQLLHAGDIAALLAKYAPVIDGRCIVRLKGHADADDVAQNVRLRLLAEFHKGKRYDGTPYRVVVNKVIDWTLGDHFAGRRTDVALPHDWDAAADDETEAVDSRNYLMDLFRDLPEKTRRVLELRYVLGLEHDQIARQLGMEPNAVYQRLHQGHARLRAALAHG
jgi:RNA polymerase sigma factor (sigma-70 family)